VIRKHNEERIDDMKFKKIKWVGCASSVTGNMTIHGVGTATFIVLNCYEDRLLRLISCINNDVRICVVPSMEEGKNLAQSVFEDYCKKIINSIVEN